MGSGGQRRSMSLLVRNIKYQTSPDRVREIFEKFGSIRDVYLPLDYHTRRPRGFGFVEFYDEQDAEAALREMDNYEIDGNRIEVTMAQRGRSEPEQMRHRESKYGSRGGERSHYRRSSPSYDRRKMHRRSVSPQARKRRARSPSYSESDRSPSPRRFRDYHNGHSSDGKSLSNHSRDRFNPISHSRSPRNSRMVRRYRSLSQGSRSRSVSSASPALNRMEKYASKAK